ncbi:MAG: hypothetical protein M1544_00870 [Candidatus Marsarchaeota archaeon]|nr:hypothetical protein [Candidatus Marsarchaeota archaeon]
MEGARNKDVNGIQKLYRETATEMMSRGKYISCFYLATKLGNSEMAMEALKKEAERFSAHGLERYGKKFLLAASKLADRGELTDIEITEIEKRMLDGLILKAETSLDKHYKAFEATKGIGALAHAKRLFAASLEFKNVLTLKKELMGDWALAYREPTGWNPEYSYEAKTTFWQEFYEKLSYLLSSYDAVMEKKLYKIIPKFPVKPEGYNGSGGLMIEQYVKEIFKRTYEKYENTYYNPSYLMYASFEELWQLFGPDTKGNIVHTDLELLYDVLAILGKLLERKNTEVAMLVVEGLEACAYKGYSVRALWKRFSSMESGTAQKSLDDYSDILRR